MLALMIYVVEIYRGGANVFRSGANFLTFDEPDAERLGERVFWSADEARAAWAEGASIFADYGPAGYRAYQRFEAFLQECGLVPKPEAPSLRRRPAYRRRL